MQWWVDGDSKTPEDARAARERWLREEIPARVAELERDPSTGIPAEQVFAELEERHARRMRRRR
jgi:antitoxin ParD1/3/4